MEIVRYKKGGLAGGAVFMAACAALFVALFLYPEEAARIRGARMFATSVGHYLLAPGFIAASAFLAFRLAAIALGDSAAIEARRDALYVTTVAGRRRIGWDELVAVGLQPWYGHDHLVFHSRTRAPFGGSAHRVNLSQLDLAPDRVEELFDRIEQVRSGLPAAGVAAPPAPRAEPAPAVPARPAFGRKAV